MNVYRIRVHSGDEYGYVINSLLNFKFVSDLVDGKEVFLKKDFKIKLSRKNKKRPDLIGNGSLDVFLSEKFKTLIENNIEGININFIKIKIDKYDYWLLNIIENIECLDKKNSIYSVFRNGLPNKITDLKLNFDKIPEVAIFRMKEKPFPIFVTEKLKKIIEEANITGIKFNEDMNLTIGI